MPRDRSEAYKAGALDTRSASATGFPRPREGGFLTSRVKPIHDRIIVKRLAEEERRKGGIIIPDTAKEKPQQGKVVAVGPGKREDGKLFPLDVKAGDIVLFAKYGGTEIKLDGEDHLILREHDVLGIVEG
jgi:chaperonin GroES